jgi:hypothetical protein
MENTIKKGNRLSQFLFMFISVWCSIVYISCVSTVPRYSQKYIKKYVQEKEFVRPSGVDSIFAKEVFSEKNDLFVAIENEEKAKSRIEEAKQKLVVFRELKTLSAINDSSYSSSFFLKKLDQLEIPSIQKIHFRRLIENQDVEKAFNSIYNENSERLIKIKYILEEAHALNPFEIYTMVELSQVYIQLGKRSNKNKEREKYYSSAINILYAALNRDKGNHIIYNCLGEIYMIIQDWEKANEFYNKAYDVLRAFEFLPSDLHGDLSITSVDSSTIFKYLLCIIQSYIKIRDSENALVSIDMAAAFAGNEKNRKILEEYKELINWASGDILARELFVEGGKNSKEGDYFSAAENYQKALKLIKIDSKKAYWETAYLLSMIEYQHLSNNKKYVRRYRAKTIGMNRLIEIINEIPKDTYGAPLDASYIDYFNVMGTMLFNEGVECIKAHESVTALALLQQGAVLRTEMQAKSCLELAKLTMHYGSIGLRWALITYSLKEQLNNDEIIQLYKLIRFATKRSNNHFLCKYFNEEFKSFLFKNPLKLDLKTRLIAYKLLQSSYDQLDQYLYDVFKVKLDPIIIKKYEKLYQKNEKRLPKTAQKSFQNEIGLIDQKIGNVDLLGHWKEYSH